ncbi:MAG: hypothetical protein LCH91_01755 [Bacteroidetes bacterium]|nr:hypothetical protein [Bacteroidota bacterium]
MSHIIYEYQNEKGETILVQAEDIRSTSSVRGGRATEESTIKRVQVRFEEALGTVKAAASALKNVVDEVKPDEFSVEFNLKAEGKAGFFAICQAATGAEFKITLTWKKDK